MSRTYHCEKNCCKIEVCEYKNASWYKRRKGPSIKAGVFIYDPVEGSVLLVQSRGLLWGCPKGTLESEKNETTIECAVRELKEETGIDANPENFVKVTNIKNRAIYYYMEMKTCEVKVQTHEGNDANGITWIKMSCLEDCINSGMISLNQHARVVFKKFMDKSFPKGDFKKVEFRHTKRSR
jgi:ADP-ribose pyrophosphatase YjhB (NUDIX family)